MYGPCGGGDSSGESPLEWGYSSSQILNFSTIRSLLPGNLVAPPVWEPWLVGPLCCVEGPFSTETHQNYRVMACPTLLIIIGSNLMGCSGFFDGRSCKLRFLQCHEQTPEKFVE